MSDTRELLDQATADVDRRLDVERLGRGVMTRRRRRRRARVVGGTSAVVLVCMLVAALVRFDADQGKRGVSVSVSAGAVPKADGPERFRRVTTSGLSVMLLAEPSTALTQRVTARLEQVTKDAEAAGRQGVPKRCFPDRGFALDVTRDGKAQLDAADRDGYALQRNGAVLSVAEAIARRTPDGRVLNVVVVRSDPNADVRVSLVVHDQTVDTVSPEAGWAVLVSVTDDLSFLSDTGIRGTVVATNASGTELGRRDVPVKETPGEYCPR